MAGRGNKKLGAKYDLNKKWIIGAYGRRSYDDNESIESNTIKNQKILINNYISNTKNIELYDYYMDDGYSGTNFNRPNFKRMMEDIKTGKINGIIVKDLSRLARNHKEAGQYIEEIFPLYKLRIIAINDNIDSFENPKSIDTLIIPIKNLMNEGYARDISKKVSTAYQMMARSGQFVAGTAPYGYKIDPKNKHHLIIDSNEAIIVQKIFQMTLDGNGRIKICKYLNDNNILCRKELQYRNKHNIDENDISILPRYSWCTTTIGRMLSNETYIGNLVQLKTKREKFGTKHIIDVPKENWIKCEGTHEAIISKEKFYKIQNIINSRNYKKNAPRDFSMYNGILKCNDCKSAMIRCKDKSEKGKEYVNYYCLKYKYSSNSCSPHKITENELNEMVKKSIHIQVKLIIDAEKQLKLLCLCNNSEEVLQKKYDDYTKLIENKINIYRHNKMNKYIEWKKQEITKNEFLKISKQIEQKINKLENEYKLNSNTFRNNLKKLKSEGEWIQKFKKYKNIKKLNARILKELIKVIYVSKEGNIEIVFKYQDEFLSLKDYITEGIENRNEKMASRNLYKVIE